MEMRNAEFLIWPHPNKVSFADYTEIEWHAIAEFAIHAFKSFWTADWHPEEPLDACVDDNGFSVEISSVAQVNHDVNISWKGIVGGSVLGDADMIHVSATMFPYIHHRKVITIAGDSFLEFALKRGDNGAGVWRVVDWMKDEFGEYGYFDQQPA